jgi:hypothetical protein
MTDLVYVAIFAAIVLAVVIPVARAVASIIVPLSIVIVVGLIVLDQANGGRVTARATAELGQLLRSLPDRIAERMHTP